MKLGTMLVDVSSSLVRPPVTEKYPYERRPVPATLRGQLHWMRIMREGLPGLCN